MPQAAEKVKVSFANFVQLVADHNYEDVIIKNKGEGYDADKDEFVDMVKEGIIDPAKVTRSALQNATSIASIFLTMEGAVTDIPEEKKEEPQMPGGGGMGMPGMM